MVGHVVLVNGLPGAGKTTLAAGLASATGWTHLSKDAVKESLAEHTGGALTSAQLGAVAMDAIWSMAGALPGVVLVDSWWFAPRDLAHARTGLQRAGAQHVVEVWCEADPAVVRRRYAERRRSPVHEDASRLRDAWDDWLARGRPLGLGPVVRVGTGGPVDVLAVRDAITAWFPTGPAADGV